MPHDPTDKKLARRHTLEQLEMFDIDTYISENPTLVDGYPADPLADAFACKTERSGLYSAAEWDEIVDAYFDELED